MNKVLLGLLAATMLITPTVLAGHGGGTVTVHETYEFGPPGDLVSATCVTGSETLGTGCDPTGQTQDNSIDVGGSITTPDEVPAGVDAVQAAIVDDVFGANTVGGWICTDENGDGVACDEDAGEVVVFGWCGQSPVVEIPAAPNFDAVVLFINGPIFQAQDCVPTEAPTSTTGGVVNPSGGVFLAFQ